jgi:signal transduction histidine kinase
MYPYRGDYYMQNILNFFKQPSIYYAIFLASLFPFLKFVNGLFLSELGFRIIHPLVFGLFIGYLIGKQFEKVKELSNAQTQSQQEIIDLMKKKSDLQSENRARFAFIANTSHELRTPLNAVIGFSDLLVEKLELGERKNSGPIEDLEKINKAGKHLLSLINDLLDLSKLNSGKMELFFEEIDVDLLLHDLVTISEPLVKKKNNHMLIDNKGISSVYADEMKLKQSLLNLISNASKFTEHGGITLSAKAVDGYVHLSVSDTGIGMTKDQKEVVFEEFKQAESSTSKIYGGTGLGLALTKQFIELMGGTIQVESYPNQGSVFTIGLNASAKQI